MNGPDDRLLQRLADALAQPAPDPDRAELRRLWSAVTEWRRRLGAAGANDTELPADKASTGSTTPHPLPPIIFGGWRSAGSDGG